MDGRKTVMGLSTSGRKGEAGGVAWRQRECLLGMHRVVGLVPSAREEEERKEEREKQKRERGREEKKKD